MLSLKKWYECDTLFVAFVASSFINFLPAFKVAFSASTVTAQC